MNTAQSIIQFAKKIADEDPALPGYVAVGTGTTSETRADTDLVTESNRAAILDSGSGSGVGWVKRRITSAESLGSYTEFGVFDDPSSGNLFVRHVIDSVTHSNDDDLDIITFCSFNPNNTVNSILTSYFVSSMSAWFGNTDFTSPAYTGFSTMKIVDSCESLGVNPNDWQDSVDASSAALNSSNFQEGEKSIDLGKDGVVSSTAYYERTLASTINLSAATHYKVWVNIMTSADLAKFASSNCLTIRVGNDSSNYEYYQFDSSDIIVGWQQLNIVVSDMSSTGSPSSSAYDYLYIGFTTNNITDTVTSGNVIMDYWAGYKAISYSDTSLYDEQYIAVFDSTVRSDSRVTFKIEVGKADGNTYVYNYLGLFDAAASGNMFYANEFLDVIKSSFVKIINEVSITFLNSD